MQMTAELYKTLCEMQAELCKTLVNHKRIEILNFLQDDERTVGELVASLSVPKSNVSQHLAVMRHKGVLTTRREGSNIYYRVANPKIITVLTLMREVLLEQQSARERVVTRV